MSIAQSFRRKPSTARISGRAVLTIGSAILFAALLTAGALIASAQP
jgi:hypothetical protein